jgi:hypothetical protein
MAILDIKNGIGLGFIDPHGEASEELLKFVPEERIEDVIYFNPSDIEKPIAFNIMEEVDPDYRHLIAGGLMGVFKKIWPDVWSSRMEYILNNAVLALIEIKGSTLLGINRLLSDAEWRKEVLEDVHDPVVKAFWTKEFSRYSQRYETEATAAIQNKIGQFISSPLIRNIVGQKKSTIDIRSIMDNKKILLVNLSKGRTGELNSQLLGMIFVMKFQAAAMGRANIPEDERQDFALYVDEFQNFATDSFETILSEARKYRLNLILANQFMTQLTDEIRESIIGNIGTIISGRLGLTDAELLQKKFQPVFDAEDLTKLPNYQAIASVIINGVPSSAFSMGLVPPMGESNNQLRETLKKLSAAKYGHPKSQVEADIFRRLGAGDVIRKAKLEESKILQNQKPISQSQTSGSSFLDEWLAKRQQIVDSTGNKPSPVINTQTKEQFNVRDDLDDEVSVKLH